MWTEKNIFKGWHFKEGQQQHLNQTSHLPFFGFDGVVCRYIKKKTYFCQVLAKSFTKTRGQGVAHEILIICTLCYIIICAFHSMHFTICFLKYAYTVWIKPYAFHSRHFTLCMSHYVFHSMHFTVFTVCILQYAL